MSFNHYFYLDTTASRHELRDTLVQAGFGLQAKPDMEVVTGGFSSRAYNETTSITILDDPTGRYGRPDNGVLATYCITFHDRRAYLSKPEFEGVFERQTVQSIMVLLKAYPEADAFWLAYDAEIPMLLRRGGHLVLSQRGMQPGYYWDAGEESLLALVDLPYTIEPLGPWRHIHAGTQQAGTQDAPAR